MLMWANVNVAIVIYRGARVCVLAKNAIQGT